MQYIENEKCETKVIDSFWSTNNNVSAQAAFVYPVPEGSYSVNISCEGFQSVDHIGGNEDGYWIGLIAYSNSSGDNWGVGNYKGCSFKNFLATNTWRPGHKDLKLNDCQFTDGQIVERDAVMSFHVEATGTDACFYLMAPKTMKTDKYNYVVSYGGYTNKRMEFGTISVTCDESDVEAERITRHAETPIRSKHILVSERYEEPLPTIINQGLCDVKTPEQEQTLVDEEDRQTVSTEPDIALQEYEAATAEIPDAEEDVLPSKEQLSSKPLDTSGNTIPKPKEPEVLGTYQGQNIYPEDVPPLVRQRLREAAKAPSTLLYERTPKKSNNFLTRFVEANRSPTTPAAPTVSTASNMTREQLAEYTRIRKSLGLTAAKEYKAQFQ
jgi:hypothetical protein